ncbi:MAG TPA: ClpX C4-type zinc finger protein [Acidimicrobiia bacterium]
MQCSFCDAEQEDKPGGRRMIGGPEGVAICSDCVRLCVEVLEADPRNEVAPGRAEPAWSPR